ncbi:MAG: AAA family ATPase, partial [Sulfobacillus sp.]
GVLREDPSRNAAGVLREDPSRNAAGVPREDPSRNAAGVPREESLSAVVHSGDDGLTLSYMLNVLDGTLCKENTIFVITTNCLECLDPALVRRGRIDVSLKLDYCDHYQISTIYSKMMRRELSMQCLSQIPEGKFSPAEVIFEVFQHISTEDPEEIIMERFFPVIEYQESH